MRIPLSWLREYVTLLPSAEKLAERLTMSGVEVENIIDQRKGLDKVVVGEVVDLKPHPQADKLRLAYVRIGTKREPQEIVCGAPNIAIGQKVPVALLGAKLPNGLTIEARKIRGIESQGMVCSEHELGLGSDHTGIMVLDASIEVGTPLIKAMGWDDVILEIAIPANRSDLLSVRGIAREVAAVVGGTMKDRIPKVQETNVRANQSIQLKISTKGCTRFTSRVIRGVSMKPSPDWLQRRLRQSGMRSVNLVVDVTNYVMLEYGQPLHAYDASKLKGKVLTARDARAGETVRTLDGKTRKLDSSVLVIADSTGAIGLAGVMGGESTEIGEATTDIVLEAAIFDPVRVRKTSRQLGLVSEASKRFEKGLPIGLQEQASNAAAQLIMEIGGGHVEKGVVIAGTAIQQLVNVNVPTQIFSQILGQAISIPTAKRTLTKLGFKIQGTQKQWKVRGPAWRLDVNLPEDVVDEVGRVQGYQDLPEVLPPTNHVPHSIPELVVLKDALRDELKGFGFMETLSHAFYGESTVPWLPDGEHVVVANPLDASQELLRRSLLPQLESALELSADRGEDLKLFEIGRVFLSSKGKIESQQPWKLGIGVVLKPTNQYVRGRMVKGVAEELLSALHSSIERMDVKVREVKGRVIETLELDVAEIRDHQKPTLYTATPLFPSASRDIAIWVPTNVTYHQVVTAVETAGIHVLEKLELFDVFEKQGKRSLAFRLTFRRPDQTLTEAEISATMKAITEAVRQLGAELR